MPTGTPLCVETAADGVVRVIFELSGSTVNKIDGLVLAALDELLSRFEAFQPAGIVFTSARDHFCVGADVALIAALDRREEAFRGSQTGQDLFDRIEALTVPTVAAIRGACLGGGLEWALACDRIVAADATDTRLGFPEVQLGILPAWGGTQRLTERLGLGPAVDMMATGRRLAPAKALAIGLVDRVVPADQLEASAVEMVQRLRAEHGGRPPRVRRRGFVGLLARLLPPVRALVFRQVRAAVRRKAGSHYPAPFAIVQAVTAAVAGSREQGLALERELFGELVTGEVSRNLVGFFFLTQEARGWYDEEHDPGCRDIESVAVLGAGIMGAGIARLCAERGLEVVLRDISEAALEKGMGHVRKALGRQVERRRLTPAKRDAVLQRLRPTSAVADLAGVDLVVEAVIEDLGLKKKVLAEAEGAAGGALLASNTSALSVSAMSEALAHPATLGGLHFFNPVDQMPLVEVVAGSGSAPATVGALLKVVRRLGKTPVRVSDTAGFLVNRILSVYLGEALVLVEEGMAVDALDRRMKAFGMPMGPLELLDRIGLDVADKVVDSLTAAFGERRAPTDLIARMLADGRLGAKGGRGFYVHTGRRSQPDRAGLQRLTGRPGTRQPDENVVYALIDPMVAEAARCLDERVVERPGEVDLALVMGIGWPPFTGGLLRWADAQGLPALVARLALLAETEGARLEPPACLVERAERGESFHPAA